MSESELKLVESVPLGDGNECFLSVAISADGSRLAAAGGPIREPGIVKILDCRTREQIASFSVAQPGVTGLAFSPTSDLLAVSAQSTDRLGIVAIGLESGSVVFWGLEQRKQIGRIRLAKDVILSLAFAPCENAVCSVAATPSEPLMWHTFRLH